MYELLCHGLWGDKWPPAAYRLGIPPTNPPPPRLSLDELRKLIFGGIVITEQDWKDAKEISDIAKTQRKREHSLPWTKSRLDSYFANGQSITPEKYLDWKNLQQQQLPYGHRIMPKKRAD